MVDYSNPLEVIPIMLRIALLIVIFIEMKLLRRVITPGKTLYSWSSKAREEFKLNMNSAVVWAFAIFILEAIQINLPGFSYYLIIIDLTILAGIEWILLAPKRYVATDFGMLIHGSFKPWEKFSDYRINEKAKIVTLIERISIFEGRKMMPLRDIDAIKKILSEHIQKR